MGEEIVLPLKHVTIEEAKKRYEETKKALVTAKGEEAARLHRRLVWLKGMLERAGVKVE
jgi:hypothetical protein